MIALQLDCVSKDYGPVRALVSVTLALESGQLVWLRGANGAGKSTLLRVLGALTRPTRGRVRVLARDPFASEGAALRARVGFLGQDAALYGELTVDENLRFCARLRGLSDDAAASAASALELDEVRGQRVRTLSQGYRRRAGLARALLGAPELVLLDEPWNGLDAAAAEQLSRLLVRLRDAGATVLVAAHGAEAAGFRFDRTLALEHGRLAAA